MTSTEFKTLQNGSQVKRTTDGTIVTIEFRIPEFDSYAAVDSYGDRWYVDGSAKMIWATT